MNYVEYPDLIKVRVDPVDGLGVVQPLSEIVRS